MRRPARLAGGLVVLLVALTSVAGCGGSDGQFRGVVLDQPYQVADTALTDTADEPYSLAADTDKPLTLVFFGYIRCPDICQTVMSSLAVAMTRLDPADRKQVDVVFVTTDPQRDTPAALRTYLDRFDPAFIGLTGDLADITAVGRSVAVAVDRGEKLPSGGYEVVHGTHITGIDAYDRAPVIWTEDTSAAQFAHDIHQLLADGGDA